VKCKGHNFFQIYTFSDIDFSTLIENRNNFQFSQDFVRNRQVNLIKTAGNIIHGYSPLKISCRDIASVISSFYGDKDNQTIFFICVQSSWAGEIGHHFESFTVATTNWLTAMEYLCHK
jgi:hypothetical protein